MTKDSDRNGQFLLIYGSQTGQAKAIAEEFCENTSSKGLKPQLFCLSLYEKKFSLEKEKFVAIIVSTTGEGEPPETACKFWRRLRRTTLDSNYLSHLNYALLGLGDSNYTNFCNFGKSLDRRLEELGAKRFLPSAWADDAVGLELAVEPWMESACTALSKLLLPADSGNSLPLTVDQPVEIATETSVNILTDTSKMSVLSAEDVTLQNMLSPDVQKKDDVLSTDNMTKPSQTADHTTGQADQIVRTNDVHQASTTEDSTLCSTDSVCSADDVAAHFQVPESLTKAYPPLADANLTVPLCPPRFLKLSIASDEKNQNIDQSERTIQNGCSFPGAQSPVTHVPVIRSRQLTNSGSVKTTLELELDITNCNWTYEPGDTVGVVCPNSAEDVQLLVDALGLTNVAHSECQLELIVDTKKRNASIPEHLPQRSTIFHLLQTCCEIRDVPRKSFLRALVDYTSVDEERRRIQELCSKQGSDHYTKFIRQPGLCLHDLLMAFPSCRPPIDLLLEHLPRLQPRAYSASSSLLDSPDRLQFMFNIIEIPKADGRYAERRGVCTGWLSQLTALADLIDNKLANLSLNSEKSFTIPVFLRTNRFFRLPNDRLVPLIMIGPGTGVAPFLGFVKHRDRQILEVGDRSQFGEMWLFYGCRHHDRDYLCRTEVEDWEKRGVLTRACVSFSRDTQTAEIPAPRYVQDNLRLHGEHMASLICDRGAYVYVCGDAIGMSPQVLKTIAELLVTHRSMDQKAADAYLVEMRLNHRYLEDIWV